MMFVERMSEERERERESMEFSIVFAQLSSGFVFVLFARRNSFVNERSRTKAAKIISYARK
jgi:hypothetical protein